MMALTPVSGTLNGHKEENAVKPSSDQGDFEREQIYGHD
jgi:hypothetical protein